MLSLADINKPILNQANGESQALQKNQHNNQPLLPKAITVAKTKAQETLSKLSQVSTASITTSAALKSNPYAKSVALELQRQMSKLDKATKEIQKTLGKPVIDSAEVKKVCVEAVAAMTLQLQHLKAGQKFIG